MGNFLFPIFSARERRLTAFSGEAAPRVDSPEPKKNTIEGIPDRTVTKERAAAIQENSQLIANNQEHLERALRVCGQQIRQITDAQYAVILRKYGFKYSMDNRQVVPIRPFPNAMAAMQTLASANTEFKLWVERNAASIKAEAVKYANWTVLKDKPVQLEVGRTTGTLESNVMNVGISTTKDRAQKLSPQMEKLMGTQSHQYNAAFLRQFGPRLTTYAQSLRLLPAQLSHDQMNAFVRSLPREEFSRFKTNISRELNAQIVKLGTSDPGRYYNEMDGGQKPFITLQFSWNGRLAEPDRPSTTIQTETRTYPTPQPQVEQTTEQPRGPELTALLNYYALYGYPPADTSVREVAAALKTQTSKTNLSAANKILTLPSDGYIPAGLQRLSLQQLWEQAKGRPSELMQRLNQRLEDYGCKDFILYDGEGKGPLKIIPKQTKAV